MSGLRTEFATRDGVLPAVADVSFELARGEVLGLVGESGSGKSVTGFSILGLIDPPGRIAAGSICNSTAWNSSALRPSRCGACAASGSR